MTKEQNMFENPFREGGEISKDADDIVDAFKKGKLSEISNLSVDASIDVDKDNDDNRESLVQPLERKNGVLVVDAKKEKKREKDMPEEKKLKKYYCCSVL